MQDPYPDFTFDDAVAVLVERYGKAQVRIVDKDDVLIDLLLPGSTQLWTNRLSWQQAKYLAKNDISPLDLHDWRFPDDWPTDPPLSERLLKRRARVSFPVWKVGDEDGDRWVKPGEIVRELSPDRDGMRRFFLPASPQEGTWWTWEKVFLEKTEAVLK